jgi:hypothetical protein
VLWGVDWQVGCLPMGSFVSFGEDVPPPAWVGFLTHGVVGVPCLLAGLWLAPEHLAGAARITWAWVSFGRSPTGGPIGTLGHLWRSEPDDVTGYVLATLTTLAAWNLALVLGQAAASRVPRSGIVGAVLYAAWAGWAVWLDWTA